MTFGRTFGVNTLAFNGVFRGDDTENLQLPIRSSIDERERELITSLYPALWKIAAVAGSVDVEPDDLVQERCCVRCERRR